jgi:hypothetical protein
MQTAPRIENSSSDIDWIATIQQADHALSLLHSLRTSTIEEAEYAKFLLQIVAALRDSTNDLNDCATRCGSSRANTSGSNLQQGFKAVRSFLSQLESRVNPDSSHDRPAFAEGSALRWQLKSDEVTHFVRLADSLFSELDDLRFLLT